MAHKKIIRISLVGLMLLILIALMASSITAVTPSATNACEETAPDRSKKNDSGVKGDIDFETLSGKFFSSVSY